MGLLAITAGAASGRLPVGATLALPILFASAMSLMDTADGVFMCKAYDWAFAGPGRKLYYNITVTALSVAVTLIIGAVHRHVADRRRDLALAGDRAALAAWAQDEQALKLTGWPK